MRGRLIIGLLFVYREISSKKLNSVYVSGADVNKQYWSDWF